MDFKTLTGQVKKVPKIKKHLIDWDKKSRSKFQFDVKKILEPYWQRHVVFEEFPIAGTRLSLDFYNANKKIAIEVQGDQHVKYIPFFHGGYKNNYLSQLDRDNQKSTFCDINNILLFEIYQSDELSVDFFIKNDII